MSHQQPVHVADRAVNPALVTVPATWRLRALLAALLAVVAVSAGVPMSRPAQAAPAVAYTNPLVNQRADPHIVRHTDGYYYMTATVPQYDRIVLRRATTLQGLGTATETTIWRRHTSGEMGAHIWAPEIHFINGKWYVYFAAGRADDVWRIRMYVLESASANPLSGSWTERGRITTPWDTFSLDASTFVVNGVRYLTWAQQEPGISTNSNVYLARMGADPWQITGPVTRLVVPAYDWETRGFRVAEGPAVIQRNGRVFLTYSASATDANYCLGMLTASAGANLLDAAAWRKSPTPVFASNAATGQYGPGHNSFTVSEDGQSDILVYHDRNYRDISGDPLNDPNRRTRIQKLYWNADGTPNFGIPVPDGATPVRLRSHDLTGGYVRHYDYRARVEPNVTNLADSQFRVVPGLAGGGTVSLESTNFPGYFLRHRDFALYVERDDGSTLFDGDASFHRRSGLAASAGLSLESQNFPGRYVRHRDGLLHLETVSSSADRDSATFHLE
ncbi:MULTISPECIES: family 43 glycosylhydrolase [unclassified Micromonospora]|uniref:family 43 glycosylhydrolase n=1 Tax=unclassified Micromonospora TaxID=2617518 RepID=UPI001C24246A|nr:MULTISPECIES: family 43 glycosylhydrolase [unclassified Micromonospora]MBU8861657.1 family 43 glycosylhydrolase [Micromonospora sp. WMMB482]MDM4781226.1 family 43 glycosylhydrolase [Micromonospora sp. b486]